MLKMAELPFNGETTSKLLSIFSHAKHRIEEFELNPNFVVYVYKMLMSKSTKFNLAVINICIFISLYFLFKKKNLVDTLKHLSKFKFDDQKNIEDHLVN